MKYYVKDVIQELERITNEQRTYLNEKLLSLSEDDLTWRPAKYRWNIYEVIEHLNRFGDHYLPKMSHVVEFPKSIGTKEYYKTGFLGEFSFRQLRPVNGVVPNKAKSPSRTNPFLRKLDKSVFDVHQKQQENFMEIIKGAPTANLSRNSIPTLAARWLRFNFGDSMRILAYHAERHYVQIDNLVNKRTD